MTRQEILNLFDDCIFEDLSPDTFESNILDYLPSDFYFDYQFGATRGTIIPIGENFVIKIPFKGSYDEEYSDGYNYDSEGRSYEYSEDDIGWHDIFNMNACANRDDRYCWDYCLGELLKYRKAKTAKVNRAFCETKLIGYSHDHPIYIQQRAIPACDRDQHVPASPQMADYIRSSCESTKTRGRISFDWLADALVYYGKDFFLRFLTFIKDNRIDDLRDDNIGYIGDAPVLFDYACYMEA